MCKSSLVLATGKRNLGKMASQVKGKARVSLEVGSVFASGEKDASQKHANTDIALRLMLKQETAINKVQKSALASSGHQQLLCRRIKMQ